jgi:hypothetical protein
MQRPGPGPGIGVRLLTGTLAFAPALASYQVVEAGVSACQFDHEILAIIHTIPNQEASAESIKCNCAISHTHPSGLLFALVARLKQC